MLVVASHVDTFACVSDRLELRGLLFEHDQASNPETRAVSCYTWLGSTQNQHIKMVLAIMNQTDVCVSAGLISGERS
jgi:hypothetical protein